jgi:DNA-binding phage protein
MSEAIKKSDIVQGDPFGEIAADITETLAALDKYDKSIKSIANTMQNDLSKAAKKTVQDIEAINKAEIESEKLVQAKIRTSKLQLDLQAKQNQLNAQSEKQAEQQARALEKEAAQKEKANKQSERAAKLAKDEASAYKQLERNTRELKNQSKELGAQMLKLEQSGKRNTAEYRKLEGQYRAVSRAAQAGDVQLKKLDKTVGDNFRNVGNYQSAIGGLKSALGSLGIAFGATQVISFLKETTELSRIQEKAVAQVAAGLKSTGGAVGFTLDELKAKASALQKDTLFGDETIMTDLTSVMLTFTNITGKAFDGAQQAALDLSTRMGGDLKGAAVQLGKALNDPIQGVTALRRVGVSFTDSQLEQIKTLQESGDLYAAQTIILNEMNKEFEGSAKAAAAADGGVTQLANAWGDAKEELGKMLLEGLKPTIQALKSFFENLSSDDIRAFVHQLGTIASVIGKVIKAYAVYRAGLIAANAAQFLFNGGVKDMLGSFMRSIPMTRAYRLEQIKLARATTTTGEAVKSTGRALNAVPWMAIIGVVIELATAFYDVASGAAEARRQQELTDKYTANAAKKADKRVTERGDNLQKEIAALQDLRNENKITEDEFLKRKEQAIKKTNEQVRQDIKSVNARKQGYKEELAALEESERVYQSGGRYALTEEQADLRAKYLGGEGVTGKIASLRASIAASNVKLSEYNKELSDVGETTKRATSEVAAYDAEQARSGNQTKANTKQVKEYKTEFKDLNEYISEQADLLQKLKDIEQERTLDSQQQNIDDMLANQVKAARETGEAQVDQLEATIAAMFQLEKDYIEQKRDFQLQQIEADYQLNKAKRLQELNDEKADLIAAADGNADAIAKINANYDAKKKQLDADEALRYEDLQLQKTIVTEEATDQVTDLKQQEHDEINRVNDAIIEGQKEFSAEVNNVNKEGSDKDVDAIKERYDLIQGIQQAATDALKEQIDKRIDLLQQEADAAKTQQDFLQNLAANGNIYAQQSIAEQIRIQREAQQEQLRLERQKQSIELISAGLKTFEASLSEGKTPAQALAATVVSTQVLTGFLKNLQFFEKGTMNAPGGLSVVDEKGAELITDRRGNIKEMGAGKGARFTMLSPGDKVYTASQTSSLLSSFDSVGNMSKIPKALSASGGFETATITRELKALQQIVSNKSESNVHWESFSSGISEIVQNKNVGGRKITNRFRVK